MNRKSRFAAALLAGALLLGISACGTQGTASFASPVELTVWTYYNGDQLETFNRLVEEFNDTVGRERNIEVIASGQGSVNDLETNVMNAAEGKVGAEALPNIFSAYADTAYAIDRMGLVVDLAPYLDEKEREKYIEAYLEEGDFDGDGSIKIFPTAKCTELLFLNDTDWQKFAQAAGADYSDLLTVEGVVRTAEKYYDWTDAQTDAPADGRALFGRDAMANYILAGAKELGAPIFRIKNGRMTLNFDRDAVRRLWDNYYVPFIKGYFSASGRFRSDEIKSGGLLAYVGSNASATFLPTQVIRDDGRSYDITMRALPDVRGLRAGGGAAGRRHGRDPRHRRADRGFGRVSQMDHRAGKQHQLFGRLGLYAGHARGVRYGRHRAERTAAERQHEGDPLDCDRHGEQLRAVYHAGVHRRKGCAQYTGILHERPCIGRPQDGRGAHCGGTERCGRGGGISDRRMLRELV